MDGYIEYHKTICIRPECPSRRGIEKTKKLALI